MAQNKRIVRTANTAITQLHYNSSNHLSQPNIGKVWATARKPSRLLNECKFIKYSRTMSSSEILSAKNTWPHMKGGIRDAPEFYASYKLLNLKSHREYSDKLQIKVLDLTQIELATKEDKLQKLTEKES